MENELGANEPKHLRTKANVTWRPARSRWRISAALLVVH